MRTMIVSLFIGMLSFLAGCSGAQERKVRLLVADQVTHYMDTHKELYAGKDCEERYQFLKNQVRQEILK